MRTTLPVVYRYLLVAGSIAGALDVGAQGVSSLHVCVRDSSASQDPLSGVSVRIMGADTPESITGPDGCADFAAPGVDTYRKIQCYKPGYALKIGTYRAPLDHDIYLKKVSDRVFYLLLRSAYDANEFIEGVEVYIPGQRPVTSNRFGIVELLLPNDSKGSDELSIVIKGNSRYKGLNHKLKIRDARRKTHDVDLTPLHVSLQSLSRDFENELRNWKEALTHDASDKAVQAVDNMLRLYRDMETLPKDNPEDREWWSLLSADLRTFVDFLEQMYVPAGKNSVQNLIKKRMELGERFEADHATLKQTTDFYKHMQANDALIELGLQIIELDVRISKFEPYKQHYLHDGKEVLELIDHGRKKLDQYKDQLPSSKHDQLKTKLDQRFHQLNKFYTRS